MEISKTYLPSEIDPNQTERSQPDPPALGAAVVVGTSSAEPIAEQLRATHTLLAPQVPCFSLIYPESPQSDPQEFLISQ